MKTQFLLILLCGMFTAHSAPHTVFLPDGSPAVDATVRFVESGGIHRNHRHLWEELAWTEFRTDKTGKVQLPNKRGLIQVEVMGAAIGLWGNYPAEDHPADMYDLILKPAFSVTGRVVSATDEPVAGAEIKLRDFATWGYGSFANYGTPMPQVRTWTDENGHFSLPGIDYGHYKRHSSWQNGCGAIIRAKKRMPDGRFHVGTVGHSYGRSPSPSRRGVIHGKPIKLAPQRDLWVSLIDRETGKAIENPGCVKARFDGQERTHLESYLRDSKLFAFKLPAGLPAGEWPVFEFSSPFLGQVAAQRQPSDDPFPDLDRPIRIEVDQEILPGQVMAVGCVKEQLSGLPMPELRLEYRSHLPDRTSLGWRVSQGSLKTAKTDAQGNFALGLPVGEILVSMKPRIEESEMGRRGWELVIDTRQKPTGQTFLIPAEL